jgi:hypothetical protein
MSLEDALRIWTSRAGIIRVQSALNPILWTMAIALPLFLIAAYFFRDDSPVKWTLLALGAIALLAPVTSYFIFLFRDPDRLQSEEFVLKQRELMTYGKGARPEIVDSSRDSLRVEQHPGGFGSGERQ